MKASIVIPVYNGAKSIGKLVESLLQEFDNEVLEIVLVNDFSPDNSHEVCLKLREVYSHNIKYLRLARNFGEHNAVMAGLHQASGDYVVIMDDDFQNPPAEAVNLVAEAAKHNYDIVYTWFEKKEHHWMRNLGSWFNNLMATYMLKKPRDLYLSSFKVLSRFTVNEIIKYQGPYPYIDGLALRCTHNLGKIKVKHEPRREGSSNYTLRKLISLWGNMFVNFSVMPLRLAVIIGLTFSLMGGILTCAVVLEKLLYQGVKLGWPSLMVSSLLFSGVQLFILGLLGEYLGRLFLSTNQTPQFVVREAYGCQKDV